MLLLPLLTPAACRYLTARCDDPLLHEKAGLAGGASSSGGAGAGSGGSSLRRSTAGGVAGAGSTVRLQPPSLAGSVLYSSPLSARSLSLSGRGKLADRGTIYTTKVNGWQAVWWDQGRRVRVGGHPLRQREYVA